MAVQTPNVIRESRHLWVGGLPDQITETELKDYFSTFGKIEGVKILPQKYPNIGVAAFVDFYDIKSAIDAKETKHMINGCELRTNFKAKPTEKFDGKKRPSESVLSTDKQENVRGSASTSGSSDDDSDSSSSTSSSGSLSESASKTDKKSSKEVNVLFLKVTGLANRPERVLQDGLYYEFCRYSSQAIVRMYGEGSEKKWAVVKYKKLEECREAYRQSQGMVLFGSKIRLTPLQTDDFPVGGRDHPSVHHSSGGPPPKQFLSDDTDLQATRSLFVGNIPKNISIFELRDAFQRYGNVLDVEIKKMGGNATYGFVLYYDLMSAITAKQYMDGQNLRGNMIRVGFGKGTASKTLWIDGIERNITKQKLEKHLVKYGKIVRLGIDHSRCCAMVQYETMESAKEALNEMKGTFFGGGKRILTDFANRDARAAFFSRIEEEERASQSGHFQGSTMMYNQGMMGSDPRMMMPRPGMTPMMGMGRDSFHFQGPPMDYYYSPYMEDFFAGGRPHYGPPGSRRFTHPQFGRGVDDYEDELRAFTRKREWEREREKRKVKKKYRDSSSDSQESETDQSSKQKKKTGKARDKSKKVNKKEKEKETNDDDKSVEKSEGDSESNDSNHEEARLRATKKSRELREKLKKSKKKTATKRSSDAENSCSSQDEVEKNSAKAKNVAIEEIEASNAKDDCSDEVDALDDSKKVKSGTKDLSAQCVSSSPSSNKLSVEITTQRDELFAHSLPPTDRQKLSENVQEGENLDELAVNSSNKLKNDENIKAKPEPKSPQSPFHDEKTVERVKVESDLSSGEDFKESDLDVLAITAKKDEGHKSHPVPSSVPVSDATHKEVEVFHPKKMPPNTSDIDDSTQKYDKGEKVTMSKKEQKLPRRYQIGDDSRSHGRDSSRRREHKIHSRPDRHIHHPLSSLSPPPPQFSRRRRYHSPPPPELERRRQRRGRPSSPSTNPYRKTSRSPPGFPSSPPSKGRSPFAGTSPPRPRSPPMEHRGSLKRRYDSPPYDSVRGNPPRRWSPPSPYHHRSYIPSPPPPRPRSPVGRRRPRHHTPSVSPTSRSPHWSSKREGSPSLELGRHSSPHHSEDRHDVLPRRHGKRPVHVYSRTPSPSNKSKVVREKADPQDVKRIKLDDSSSLNEIPTKQLKQSKMERSHHAVVAQSEKKQLQNVAQFTKSTTKTTYGESDIKESSVDVPAQQSTAPGSQQDNLLDLLRRYPVMWQGHLTLKNDMAAVQLHFLNGNLQLAKMCLPQSVEQHTPSLRIAQRMRLEKTQLEGVEKRIQNDGEHCLLLALPCGRDATDVHTQTNNLKNSLISYLIQKQAAGIINVQDPQSQSGYVLHIFPPCPFSQNHLSRVAPDLLSSASDDCHLMIVAATM